ncbi:MAG TPA: DNA repair exonuclease [Candidatus Limnocylindrales bacterium]|jgi:DNA repair exonuclease SbcCD nuclease subunit|nr:DNA repair exonuclease [Candidatus Limnocylindrales bacterium]
MPRLLHLADVHLGARHQDLGAAAAAQRERQYAAFKRSIDLALAEQVDVVLVAGDLFDSNQQPRRSVERVAAELGRLVAVGIRTVLLPGTHDVYDASSVYRTYDLALLAGLAPASDLLTVLTPDRPSIVFPSLDTVVYGQVFATKRAPRSPLAGLDAAAEAKAGWRVGLVHGSLRIEGKVTDDDVMVTSDEIAASGLDYLALGHWHSFQQGTAGRTTWAYAGAPEPVAVDQDGAGQVLLVDLRESDGRRTVTVRPIQVGRTRFQHLDVDAADIASQAAVANRLEGLADPDLVLDVRLVGIRPDSLDLETDEVQQALAGRFLALRLRDTSVAALTTDMVPPPDTIPGAFVHDLEARIAAAEAEGRPADAAELRESLRLGRLLLLDDPSRVTLA